MKISRVAYPDSAPFPVISMDGDSWHVANDPSGKPPLAEVVDILAFEMANPGGLSERLLSQGASRPPSVDMSTVQRTLPFQPLSYRDFMLYEKHCIDASRGFVKKYLPHLAPMIAIYEKITGKPFPKLKPQKRWYNYPIYYMGNHLSFVTDQAVIEIPSYTKDLDYELELGALLCRPLKNASPEDAEKAIGGYVVFNDFSARDVQMDEMASGFGPIKAKNFANSISNAVISADSVGPDLEQLRARVIINGKTIVDTDMKGMRYSLPEAIAYASWEEQLYPGEFFATGTVPGCSGMENGHLLKRGDSIRLEIDGVGKLENRVA